MNHGSLINTYAGTNPNKEITVGMEATVCHWTDRNPAEIAEVVLFKSGARKGEVRGVKIRAMETILISGSEHDGSAQYRYERRPDAPVSRIYLKDARGQFRGANGGSKLAIGRAERYYDPHF